MNSSPDYRKEALLKAVQSTPPPLNKPIDSNGRQKLVSEYFGSHTFGLGQMREKLPKEAYQNLLNSLNHGKKLPKETLEMIAASVKEWAVGRGVTHFTHWFHPMTGLTAEKHDSFISIQHTNHSEMSVIESFSGGQLLQGEPDASSFPSGGMRTTFEARGYTAWDPSSPLFIMEDEGGKTLCIPTVFFGYHGQALDLKIPLIRSCDILNSEACEFLKLLGDVDVKRVSATLGAEQEYFLIDKRFVALRPDLMMTGRTLIGAPSVRGQQLEDHYFGAIPRRVKAFMEEAELELYKLGIPVKTRHNEVAPSQFELAPIFEDMNIASDHNTLTMEILKRTALRHGMVCLLHEKPFAGINGSGKHNNWSIGNEKGENLLEPGVTPHQNLRFLAILSCVMKAVFDNAGILRAVIASPGNDHRLGANEAPPAIISVFLGTLLSKILNDIESGKATQATESEIINLGVAHIPDVSKDYTDRNRTSPFAFTGNKFEFRAVGSSAHVALPMTILNAAFAHSLNESTARLKELLKTKGRDEAVMALIRENVIHSKAILFEGNGYSAEWKLEAGKRGLPILSTSAQALATFADKKQTEFLRSTGVLSREEIESRYHIFLERYNKTLELEYDSMSELVQTYVLPAAEKQLIQLGSVRALTQSAALQTQLLSKTKSLETVYEDILQSLVKLQSIASLVKNESSETQKIDLIAHQLFPEMEKLRQASDKVEVLVADEFWLLPKYREMLLANTLS